jgi:NAD+ kinase
MRIAIFGRSFGEEARDYIQLLFDQLRKLGAEVAILHSYSDFLLKNINLSIPYTTYSSAEELIGNYDYMFSIGGDGTILSAVTYVRDSGIPILGINTGRLGFLATISKTQIQKTLYQLMNGKYRLEQRTLISIVNHSGTFKDENYAINEVTINRKDTTSMISVLTLVGGDYLNTYWADGLIIATPTGSTGYSLSCGGPIIMPGSQNFVITPIAPHNLNVRPLVIADNNEIRIKVDGRTDQFLVGMDSRIYTLETGSEIIIKKADFSINMLIPDNHDFASTLRNKLLWGLDRRN